MYTERSEENDLIIIIIIKIIINNTRIVMCKLVVKLYVSLLNSENWQQIGRI